MGGEEFDNPYVTDGLVTMWDGEYSSGQGDGFLVDVSKGKNHASGNFVFTPSTKSFKGRGMTDKAYTYSQMKHVEFVIQRQDSTAEQMILIGGGNRYNFAFYGYNGLWRGSGYGCSVNCKGYEKMCASFDMGAIKSWKNGVLQTTKSSDSMGNSFSKMMIGQYNSSGSYAFKGVWYCIRVYSRALTEEEIAYNYAIDKIRFNLP